MVTAFNALLECFVTALFVVIMMVFIGRRIDEQEQEYLTEQAQQRMEDEDDYNG